MGDDAQQGSGAIVGRPLVTTEHHRPAQLLITYKCNTSSSMMPKALAVIIDGLMRKRRLCLLADTAHQLKARWTKSPWPS
jgi:hypothetical protein